MNYTGARQCWRAVGCLLFASNVNFTSCHSFEDVRPQTIASRYHSLESCLHTRTSPRLPTCRMSRIPSSCAFSDSETPTSVDDWITMASAGHSIPPPGCYSAITNFRSRDLRRQLIQAIFLAMAQILGRAVSRSSSYVQILMSPRKRGLLCVKPYRMQAD